MLFFTDGYTYIQFQQAVILDPLQRRLETFVAGRPPQHYPVIEACLHTWRYIPGKIKIPAKLTLTRQPSGTECRISELRRVNCGIAYNTGPYTCTVLLAGSHRHAVYKAGAHRQFIPVIAYVNTGRSGKGTFKSIGGAGGVYIITILCAADGSITEMFTDGHMREGFIIPGEIAGAELWLQEPVIAQRIDIQYACAYAQSTAQGRQ